MYTTFDSSTASCKPSITDVFPVDEEAALDSVDTYDEIDRLAEVAGRRLDIRIPIYWRGKRLVYRQEVLYALGCSNTTLWRWIRERRFPEGFLVGGRRAWRESDITNWIDHCEQLRELGLDECIPK
jgi:predicted DNA-binding transcriptional regulator AlpA